MRFALVNYAPKVRWEGRDFVRETLLRVIAPSREQKLG